MIRHILLADDAHSRAKEDEEKTLLTSSVSGRLLRRAYGTYVEETEQSQVL